MRITKSKLEELADEAGGSARLYYSGRGMYGKSCVGIVGDLYSIGLAIGDMQSNLAGARHSMDSMGLDSIVYFPSVQVEPEVGDDVEVARNPDDLFAEDFVGRVTSKKGDSFEVKDKDSTVWTCDFKQIRIVEED